MSKISLVIGSLILFGLISAVKAEIPYNWQFKVNRDSTYDDHRNPRVSIINPERVMISWINQGWQTGIGKIDAQLLTVSGQFIAHNLNLYRTSNVIGNPLVMGNCCGTVVHLWEEESLNALFYQIDAGIIGGDTGKFQSQILFGAETLPFIFKQEIAVFIFSVSLLSSATVMSMPSKNYIGCIKYSPSIPMSGRGGPQDFGARAQGGGYY